MKTPRPEMTSQWRAIVADIAVSTVIYLLAYRVMRGSFVPTNLYVGLGGTVLVSWVILSAYFEKYRYLAEGRRGEATSAALWVAPVVLGLVATLTAVTPLWRVARSFLLVSVVALGLGTPVVAAICHRAQPADSATDAAARPAPIPAALVPWRVLAGGATVLVAFGLAAWLKTGSFFGYPLSGLAILVVASSWAASAAATRKYIAARGHPTPTERIVAHAKSVVLMMMVAATVYLMLRLDELSRWMLFGSPLLFGLLEAPLMLWGGKPTDVMSASSEVWSPAVAGKPAVAMDEPDHSDVTRTGIEELAHRLTGLESPRAVGMQQFLLECRDQFSRPAPGAEETSGLVLASGLTDDLQVQADRSLPLLVNLRPLNHIGPLNDYLREANRCLSEHGLLARFS